MEQEEDVHQRDDERLLDAAPAQGVDGALDQVGAVVEGDDLTPGGSPA